MDLASKSLESILDVIEDPKTLVAFNTPAVAKTPPLLRSSEHLLCGCLTINDLACLFLAGTTVAETRIRHKNLVSGFDIRVSDFGSLASCQVVPLKI